MKKELEKLLYDLAEIYPKSDIAKFSKEANEEWHYGLVTTELRPNQPLIVGFNWGAAKDYRHTPQTEIKPTRLEEEDLGSMKRVLGYGHRYLKIDLGKSASQTNYCFFRSKKESQITQYDLDLCSPLFDRLIATLKPSMILSFSSRLRDYLINNQKAVVTESRTIPFQSGKQTRSIRAIKARLDSGTEILFLPHPNYPMKKQAREEAWEFCCS